MTKQKAGSKKLPAATLSVKPIQSKAVVMREIEKTMILMPLHKSSKDIHYLYTLNETAALAWYKFNGKTSLSDLADILSQSYNVTGAKVEKELLEFVKDLASFKAVTYTAGVTKRTSKPKAMKPSTKKRHPWIPLQIFRVKLDPSQAVLSCCINPPRAAVDVWSVGYQCFGGAVCDGQTAFNSASAS